MLPPAMFGPIVRAGSMDTPESGPAELGIESDSGNGQ